MNGASVMRLMRLMRLIFVVLLLANSAVSQPDVEDKSFATSTAGMEQLLRTELKLIVTLENFASKLQTKVNLIRSGLSAMRAENQKSREDAEKYLSNPLNAYSLIRRMQADWIKWELFMSESVGEEEIKNVDKYRSELPNASDLSDAVTAIVRLQTTYDLKPADMAEGILNGKQYDAKLSALDCYSIGSDLFGQQQYYEAGFWLYTALQCYEDYKIYAVFDFNKLKITELYAEAMVKQNRLQDAVLLLEQGVAMDPRSARLLNKKADIETRIKVENPTVKVHAVEQPTTYQRSCRGEYDGTMPQLYCVYNKTTTHFLQLAPLKMEVVQLDPYMVLFHDVISDSEITMLKHMAIPQLKRATVYSESSQKSVVVSRRTSKFAWFADKTNIVTRRINERITDMTGFDLTGAEMLQVMNYGLGGHYDTHYDFFNVTADTDIVRTYGDRIATVLFYLSDVEQGGATVFPNIKTIVSPRKGSAVVWYNLNNRGEGDWKTMHAACPVIVGSKWVCNKWIRERSQIFVKPCYNQ